MTESSVKVGVRIRPLVPKEGHCQEVVSYTSDTQVKVKDKLFTFDYVFSQQMSQADLYGSTAFPMLKSFLDGYNVTIIAYGQTGSGKTYTMGSERTRAAGDTQSQGLIPRFLQDLFNNLRDSPDGDRLTTEVDVSFLEIYGDDVYDLLLEDRRGDGKQTSLTVREDDKGVSVLGLTSVRAHNHQEALEALQRGTQNRTTAATMMNAVSSRSHAIFSVVLTQVLRPSEFDGDSNLPSENHSVVSKLTFVDLAGSERIKRTGADGIQMKEGIQINSGLFALGQVINALADERKLAKSTKPAFVPYRNSRLTFLLKDALGGNSQTLFLACASPADANEFETLSTLDYAYRARNIKNKPIKNTDAIQEQLRRLKCAVHMWTMQAVRAKFCAAAMSSVSANSAADNGTPQEPQSPGVTDRFSFSNLDEELFERPDVKDFVQQIERNIAARLELGGPSPRKIRVSTLPIASTHDGRRVVVPAMRPLGKHGSDSDDDDDSSAVHVEAINFTEAADALDALDPEQTEKYLMELMGMLRKQEGEDDDCEESGEEDEEAEAIDQQISAKEDMLKSVITFVHNAKDIKQNYEKLLGHIQSLEAEHMDITRQLEEEKARAASHTETPNAAGVARLKDRLKTLNEQLTQMRQERKKKEESYRLYQAEARKSNSLKHEIAQLKESRAGLMRKQRGAATELRKLKQEKMREINVMKRADSKKQKQVNALQMELKKKAAAISRKDKDMRRVEEKLNAVQKHISALLNVQQANRTALRQRTTKSQRSAVHNGEQLTPADQQTITSVKQFLQQMVRDRVHDTQIRTTYDLKLSESRSLANELKVEVEAYNKLQEEKLKVVAAIEVHRASQRGGRAHGDEVESGCEALQERLKETEGTLEMLADRIADIDRNVELANCEAEQLQHDIEHLSSSDAGSSDDADDDAWAATYRAQISQLAARQSQVLLWDFVLDLCERESRIWKLEDEQARQTSAQEELNEKVASLQASNRQLQRVLQDTIVQAEQKRINDIHALLKAYDTSEPTEMPTEVHEILQRRVSELEQAVEMLMREKDEWAAQSVASDTAMADLRQQLQSANEKMAVWDAAANPPDVAPILKELQQEWDLIGTEEAERIDSAAAITNAVQLAADKALLHATNTRDGLVAERDSLEDEIDTLRRVVDAEEVDTDKIRDLPLTQQVQWLESYAASARAQLSTAHRKLLQIKDLLVTSMIEMELEVEELPATLQSLANLHVNDVDDLAEADALGERTHFLNALQRHNMRMDAASIATWESTMRDVQTMKAKRRSEALQLQDQCRATLELLNLQSDAMLVTEAAQLAMKETGDAASCHVVPRIMDHLLSNSCSCPDLTKASIEGLRSVNAVLNNIQDQRRQLYTQLRSVETLLADTVSTTAHNDDEGIDGACASVITQATDRVLRIMATVQETEGVLQQEWATLVHELKEVDTSRAPTSEPTEATTAESAGALFENIHRIAEGSMESWLQELVENLSGAWNLSREALRRVSEIKSDNKHMRQVAHVYQRARKLDAEIRGLYDEMHEFEKAASDSTRLHGSSTVLMEENRQRERFKARYNKKLVQLQEVFQNYSDLTGKHLQVSMLSKHVQLLVKNNFDKARIQTTTDLMHLHTRAVRMFEKASAPFEDSKCSGERGASPEAEVLTDANVGAGKPDSASRSPTGTPPTRIGSQSKLVSQEKRRAPRTAGQKASARGGMTDSSSTPNPMARLTEIQDENVNYSA